MIHDGGDLLIPAAGTRADARPTIEALPTRPTTRFAPAPTGHLHLGHLVNALYVWGIARAREGTVVLRIEDHDRQRSRASFEAELLDDLERLGLVPDEPSLDDLRAGPSPFRQSDSGGAYEAALASLREQGRVYACDCSRSTFFRILERTGREFSGPGCPGRCRGRDLDESGEVGLRAALGAGSERWLDLLVGPVSGETAATGDLLVRDRLGNWTYPFCAVVDDVRQSIDLVIRGRDLLDATAPQIRLARLLGRDRPPAFLHHPLVRKASGEKLSKAARDTSVRSLLDAGRTRGELFGLAARLAGLVASESDGRIRPIEPDRIASLFA